MNIEVFYDKATFTFTYIVSDPQTKHCAVIDPVLDFDPAPGRISTTSIDQVVKYITDNDLKLEWILDTHAHADHLSGASTLKSRLGGKIGLGEHIHKVIQFWAPVFNQEYDLNDLPFDKLFKDNETFSIGELQVKVMHTPGHTPACVSYYVEDAVFVGDTLFIPKRGTARTDFPGGDASTMYDSIQKLLSLPEDVRVFLCHDYPVEGEQEECVATVKTHRESNVMVNKTISKEAYIAKRQSIDKTLAAPRLILPSIQVNIRAGNLPEAEDNGIQYLKIPLNKLG